MVGQEAAPRKCGLLSTCRRVRTELAGWLVTGAGDTWTVKFDVRDLGGHLDFTTLCTRTDGVVCRAPVVYAFPLDFGSKLRILRAMFIPAALRGGEASSVSERSVCRLRSAFVRLSFVMPGLVFCLSLILELSSPLLDGPLGSDPAFHVVSA